MLMKHLKLSDIMCTTYKTPSRDFVAIDVEYATRHDQSICQFGLAVVRNAKIVEVRSWYIQPLGNKYDEQTTEVHGMTSETTADCPILPEVWPEIAMYLDGSEIWAHNAISVEVPVIEKNLRAYAIHHTPYVIYDSMRLFIREDTNRWNGGIGLESCLYAFGLPCENHHDAGEDAAMCAQVLIAFLNGQKPNWILADETMKRVKEMHSLQKEKERAEHQACQLDLFSDALTSTSLSSCTNQHAPSIFYKEYSDLDDGIDEVDYSRLNVANTNPLFGCNVVITGFFHISRSQLRKALDAMGATRSNTVTKKTQAVLIGERNVGPKKLQEITNLIHNGYNIARITGDEQLDSLLYDTSLSAKDFAIHEPAKKELNFTLNHYLKHKYALSYPNNSIANKELYFPDHFGGDMQLLCQICGNLGAFGNWDLNPQVTHVVLPLSTVAILQNRGKDDVIREYEEFYNRSLAVTFDASFVTEHDILKFVRERIVRQNDEVTARLYVAYLQSAGIDPENDYKFGLAVARRNYAKEMSNAVQDAQ